MTVCTPPLALDLFAGAGGWTTGLTQAGFQVALAVEWDHQAAATYRANQPTVPLAERDLRHRPDLAALYQRRQTPGEAPPLTLIVASPPCQPFSALQAAADPADERRALWLAVAEVVLTWQPQLFIIENVPGFLGQRGWQPAPGGEPWGLAHTFPARTYHIYQELRSVLWEYAICSGVGDAADYGVPQHRRRAFVLGRRIWAEGEALGLFTPRRVTPDTPLAEALARQLFVWPTPSPPQSVALAWAGLSTPDSGDDPLHQTSPHTPAMRQRLAALRPGDSGRPRRGVMCRMRLDEPAPTITTGCYTVSKGGFVHPTADRGITLREAARLQTFPDDYAFQGSRMTIAREIGNAMPPRWAAQWGAALRQTLARPVESILEQAWS